MPHSARTGRWTPAPASWPTSPRSWAMTASRPRCGFYIHPTANAEQCIGAMMNTRWTTPPGLRP
jgi:hypothetical protein